jgi:transposase
MMQCLAPSSPRRRRSKAERRAIVEETLTSSRSVAEVARDHNVNANQVFQWRRLYRQGLLECDEDLPRLLPVQIATSSHSSGGSIELHFADA